MYIYVYIYVSLYVCIHIYIILCAYIYTYIYMVYAFCKKRLTRTKQTCTHQRDHKIDLTSQKNPRSDSRS